MREATRTSHDRRSSVSVRCFPARSLHLVDVENLTGSAVPGRDLIRTVRDCYADRVPFMPFDQVVVASSHLTLLNAALGWPHAQYRVRSGRNGADRELLYVLSQENIAARFPHVVIGSGDGIFTSAAVLLAAAGVRVTVVSRKDSLSKQLAAAAGQIVYLDGQQAAPTAVFPRAQEAA